MVSESALQNFIHERGISLMAIQETGVWKPTEGFFENKKVMTKDTTQNMWNLVLILIYYLSL